MIDTSGLAIFGPGSEWFWVMAQFGALSVTGLAIYRQVRAQTWINQLAILSRFRDDFASEAMTRLKLESLIQIASGNRGWTPALDRVGNFFDNFAGATNKGHVRSKYAIDEYGEVAQWFWAAFAPVTQGLRASDPSLWTDWERWLIKVREDDRRRGAVKDVGPERLASWIPQTIEYYIAHLRIAQASRSGEIPTWPVPAPEPAPPDEQPA